MICENHPYTVHQRTNAKKKIQNKKIFFFLPKMSKTVFDVNNSKTIFGENFFIFSIKKEGFRNKNILIFKVPFCRFSGIMLLKIYLIDRNLLLFENRSKVPNHSTLLHGFDSSDRRRKGQQHHLHGPKATEQKQQYFKR